MDRNRQIHNLIFDTVESLIVVIDTSGVILRINPAAERATGCSETEAIGKKLWHVLIPQEQQEPAQKRLAEILAEERPQCFERFLTNRAGTRRLIRWSVGVSRDAAGAPQFVVATGTDTTGEKRAQGAEEALRDQTRLLRSVLDSVGDGVAVADESGKIIIYTPEMERIVGQPWPTVPPRQWGEYFHFFLPDGVTPFPSASLPMPRAMRGESTNQAEYQIRNPLWPEPHWCSVNGRPLRDESGRVCGGVVASRDITDRKRAESEVRFRKSLLEAQMEASIDGVLVVDPGGKILLSNSRFRSMWGIPEEIVKGGSDVAAIGAVLDRVEDPDEFVARINWLNDRPQEQSHEEIRLKDGRTIDRFSAPVSTPAGEREQIVHYGRMWIFRDITDLKEAEAEARRSADVARNNEAHFRDLAEHTRRLAREIDHRVGNNLAALLGLVAATRTRATSVDALADAIHHRLLAMAQVHQLLRQGNWRRISLAELISWTRGTIVQPHRNVNCVLEGPEVWVEPRQVSPLIMVIVELLTNSAKYGVYGTEGGQLSISWVVLPNEPDAKSRPLLRISWIERGGPPITQPVVPSLGSELVEGFVTRELLGRCELRYSPQGVEHIIEFPLSSEQAEKSGGTSMKPE
jgi:PAS domain S-box-containing protein